MRLWYLSHRRPVKVQANLRIPAVSPEPSLFAHMKYGSRRMVRPKIRHLTPLDGCTCTFEDWIISWKGSYIYVYTMMKTKKKQKKNKTKKTKQKNKTKKQKTNKCTAANIERKFPYYLIYEYRCRLGYGCPFPVWGWGGMWNSIYAFLSTINGTPVRHAKW